MENKQTIAEYIGEPDVTYVQFPLSTTISSSDNALNENHTEHLPFVGTRSNVRSRPEPGRNEIKAILEDIKNLKKIESITSICPQFPDDQTTHTPVSYHGEKEHSLHCKSSQPFIKSPQIGFYGVLSNEYKNDVISNRRELEHTTSSEHNEIQPLMCTEFYQESSVPVVFSSTPHISNISDSYVDIMSKQCGEMVDLNSVLELTGSLPVRNYSVKSSPPHTGDCLSSKESIPSLQMNVSNSEGKVYCMDHKVDSEISCNSDTFTDGSLHAESSVGRQTEFCVHSDIGFCGGQSDVMPAGFDDTEGVNYTSDTLRPDVSVYTYHPTKQFLNLRAKGPAKRRTGLTTVSSRARTHSFSKASGKRLPCTSGDESNTAEQLQHDSIAGCNKKTVTRVALHPSHLDSELVSFDISDLSTSKSVQCDSENIYKEKSDISHAHVFIGTNMINSLPLHGDNESEEKALSSKCINEVKLGKKCAKVGKQKSRSDPNGGRLREESLDFVMNMVTSESLSAPLLGNDQHNDPTIQNFFFSCPPADRRFRRSASITGDNSDEHAIACDDDNAVFNKNNMCHVVLSLPLHQVQFSSVPSTPLCNSPTIDSDNFLYFPSTSRKPIGRSASSASVYEKRNSIGSHSSEKDNAHRHGIMIDKAMSPSCTSMNLFPDFPLLGDCTSATSMPVVWKDQFTKSDSPERDGTLIKDKRYHIVEELYRNERDYVEALTLLIEKYMMPLKNSSIVDDAKVDNIFYMIPEILMHHSVYLDLLNKVWRYWDTTLSTVGNIILDSDMCKLQYMAKRIVCKLDENGTKKQSHFSKQSVLDSYSSFVENYNTSGKVIEIALANKSSTQKIIEHCQKESGSKLSMKDLIVRPIQRIPRYELLIQVVTEMPILIEQCGVFCLDNKIYRLLDNTPKNHPDYVLLQHACYTMHDLALKIGTVTESQQAEDMQESLKKLEILLFTDLVAPDRAYIRHDMVQLLNKKDQCCAWLFSDLIVMSSVKRKSGPVTRKVSIILKTHNGQDYVENIKHKVWLKVGLDCLEIVKSPSVSTDCKPQVDKVILEDDLNTVSQISDLCSQLVTPHEALETCVKGVYASIIQHMKESSMTSMPTDTNKIELMVTTQEGVLCLEVVFSSYEKRLSWEMAIVDAKNKLSQLMDTRAPEFLQPLQITKTRAGMQVIPTENSTDLVSFTSAGNACPQFSCAAPVDGLNACGFRDVWVCNSDGYIGHMCLLSLQPEPIVTLNTPVPGCNARILCICSVPACSTTFRRHSSHMVCTLQVSDDRGRRPQIQVEYIEQEEPREYESERTLPSIKFTKCFDQQSSSTADLRFFDPGDGEIRDEVLDPGDRVSQDDVSDSDIDSSDDDEDVSTSYLKSSTLHGKEVKTNDNCNLRSRVSELTKNSPDPIMTSGNWKQDALKSTMWLGTEDGCIHIFQCMDNIKTTKNKLKIQHGSSVYSIIYLDNKVFAALFNGDLIVYKRDSEGVWDAEHPYTRTVGSPTAPISRMLAVAGKLWCTCFDTIHVINPLTLSVERSFQVSGDRRHAVQCMAFSGQGVWVACQQSSKVSLFHATTFEFLLEVSIAQTVSQTLQYVDDIIRQHKAACLRITALLVCKELLWVGTSAGIILTVPVPKVTSTTTDTTLTTPHVTGLSYGHTGHVRFLTSVEMWSTNSSSQKVDNSMGSTSFVHEEASSKSGIQHRSSVAAATSAIATRMLVISGGDGYEDLSSNPANETAGRDDSTNHLLLWQV